MKLVQSILTKNPCYTAGRKITVKGLMLHSVGCSQPKVSVFINSWNCASYNKACVHGFIDGNDGTVYQTLPWNHRGWHAGGDANNTHIGVEMCEPACIKYTGGASFTCSDTATARAVAKRTYDAAVELFAMLCKIAYPPYGYDYIDGEMVVNPEQSETVKWIFAEVLSGSSTSQIAKALNARGIPTKRGGRWTGHTINGMIKNEKYTGDVIFQKTFSDDTFTRCRNNGERDQFFAQGHHEAIISHEDFDAANDMIARNAAEKGIYADSRKYQNRHAFSGKVICGDCGAVWKRRKIGDYFGYVCTTHLNDKDACSMKSIREDSIVAAFTTMMNKMIFARDKVLLPFSNALKIAEKAEYLDEFTALEEGLEKNLQKRQQITQLFTKGYLDPAVYAQQNDELLNASARLTAEKDAIIAKISGGSKQKEALEDILHYT